MKKYILFAFVVLFLSCKADINSVKKPDSQAFSIKLLFPKEECPIIRNSFTVRGIVNGSKNIKEVNVVLKGENSAEKSVFKCSVEKKADVYQWRAVLNLPDEKGAFPLKDGKYSLEVVAKDTEGKTGSTLSSIIIDNTPPSLFLQAPFFKNKNRENILFSCGSSITLRGMVEDDNKVASLDFSAYANGAWHEMRIGELSSNFDIKLDDFFENTWNSESLYRKIYGTDPNAGEKKIPFAIRIFDCAKEYESPTSKGDRELGNESDVFYIYGALEKVRFKREKELPPSLLEKDKFPTFLLNPLKNPTFEVMELSPSSLNFESLNVGETTKLENTLPPRNIKQIGDVLSIKLTSCADEIALEDSNSFDFFYCEFNTFLKFFLEKKQLLEPYNNLFDNKLKEFNTEKRIVKIENVAIKKEKEEYIAYLSIDENLKKGEPYIIFVKGSDKEGNHFIPKRKTQNKTGGEYLAYIFKIEGDSVEETSFKDDSNTLEFIINDVPNLVSEFPLIAGKFFDESGNMDASCLKASFSYNDGKKVEVPIEISNKNDWKLKGFESAKEGRYQFFFTVKDEEEREIVLKTTYFEYDKGAPLLIKIGEVSKEELENGKGLELKYFSNINSVAIGGKIKETNAIKHIKIGVKTKNGREIDDFSLQVPKRLSGEDDIYSFFEKIDFKEEGYATIVLKILDVANRESVYEVPVTIDKTAPSFEKIKIGSKEFSSFEKVEEVDVISLKLPISSVAKDVGAGIERLEIYREKVSLDSMLLRLFPDSTNERGEVIFQDILNLEKGSNRLIFLLRDKLGYETQWTCKVNAHPSYVGLKKVRK